MFFADCPAAHDLYECSHGQFRSFVGVRNKDWQTPRQLRIRRDVSTDVATTF